MCTLLLNFERRKPITEDFEEAGIALNTQCPGAAATVLWVIVPFTRDETAVVLKGACKVAQLVWVLAANPEDPSLTSRCHSARREPESCPLSSTHEVSLSLHLSIYMSNPYGPGEKEKNLFNSLSLGHLMSLHLQPLVLGSLPWPVHCDKRQPWP